MPDNSADIAYRELVARLRRLRRQDVAARGTYGIGLLLAVVFAAGLILVLLESVAYLGPLAKLLLEALIGGALFVLALRTILIPLFRPPTLEGLALRVERRFGHLQQRLISALQIWRGGGRADPGYSTDLVGAALRQAQAVASDLDFGATVDSARPRRALAFCGLAVVIAVAVFGIWSEALAPAGRRLAHPRTAYVRPPDTGIDLRPKGAVVVAGEPFEIVADLSGVVPLRAELLTLADGAETWASLDLPVRGNRAIHRFDAVTRSFAFRLRANDAETPPYDLTAQPRPTVVRITADYVYPAYTRLEGRTNVEGGDIVAPAGTRVALAIETSLLLEEAWLAFDAESRLPARTDGRVARTNLTVSEDRRYTVGLLTPRMIANRDPVEYRILALEDRPPEIRLLRPGPESELGETMRVLLVSEALDDYGLSRMELTYRVEDDGEDRILSVHLDSVGAVEVIQRTLWNLSGLGLLPGDRVACRLRVYDGNTISGPGVGESETFTIGLPSLLEIHREVQRAEGEGLDEMESMHAAGKELQERLERAAREILKGDELKWEQRKELETAAQDQTRIAEQMDRLEERLNEVLDRVEQSGLMAVDTLMKMDEVRRLMSEIDTPDLRAAMEKLREAAEGADPEAVQEALKSFRDEQEAFLRGLDRTIALLKRLKDQQMFDALVGQMQRLAQRQEEVARDLEMGEESQSLVERQDLLRRDTQSLRDEMDRAAEQVGDVDAIKESLARTADELRERRVPPRMGRVSADLARRRREDARKGAASIAEDLAQMATDLEAARRALMQAEKAEMARELNRILHDLLALSNAQEGAALQAKEMARDDDPSSLALKQARLLSGAGRMAERLLEASQKTFFVTPRTGAALGEALLKMGDVASHLQGRNPSSSSRSAGEAMGALNLTAMLVRQALNDQAAAASALGFEEVLQQMQEMADAQGELNTNTESLFGQSGKPGGPMPEPSLGFGQLSARQQALQKALEEMWERMASERQRVLGNMGNVASEMEAVAKQLGRRHLTPQTLDRQRRILSRLLDAQRSIRERGWSRQRQARPGKEVAYRGPGSLPPDLGEADNPLRRRLRDALNAGYPAEYQPLIRRYFERLMEDAVAAPGVRNGADDPSSPHSERPPDG